MSSLVLILVLDGNPFAFNCFKIVLFEDFIPYLQQNGCIVLRNFIMAHTPRMILFRANMAIIIPASQEEVNNVIDT